jgi:hypothetical protein
MHTGRLLCFLPSSLKGRLQAAQRSVPKKTIVCSPIVILFRPFDRGFHVRMLRLFAVLVFTIKAANRTPTIFADLSVVACGRILSRRLKY